MPSTESSADLEDQAFDWLVLLSSADTTAEQRLAYQCWRRSSAAHTQAAQNAEQLWADIGSTPTAASHTHKSVARLSLSRRARRVSGMVAAVVLAGVLGYGTGEWQSDFHTGVGEHLAETLGAGVKVTLNTATALTLIQPQDQRQVTLDRGEALFEVSAETGPALVIRAGLEQVSSRDGVFSVRRQGDSVIVVVVKGSADVEHQGQLSTLWANEQAAYSSASTVSPSQKVDAQAVTAWRRGKLIFNRKPLGEVLAELERYRHGKIVLPDSKLATLQVSGVFDLNDPQNLLTALEQRYQLKITYLPWLAWVH